ncbi:IclR family transcriptional regulator [Tessaracoccus lubricantis]|uniref:IclR family transcriptional regulator n=1 Tax=Tessaracoccus lubricantis TaxID=545543 RepID=A0ABP9EZR7_9ACTN
MADNSASDTSGPVVRTPIQVIDRAIALLSALAEAGAGGVPLKDLTAAVGLRPSTARTLLAALVTHGMVRQEETSRRYQLGSAFLRLSQRYVARSDLTSIAAPILRELWQKSRETVHLSILANAQRVDLMVLVSPQILNINPTAGRLPDTPSTPPYLTAAGKVLLAGWMEAERSALFDRAGWAEAVRSREGVEAMLEQVASSGWAINQEEEEPGVCGVAAPVRDHTGRVIAALCIGYPSVRYTREYEEMLRLSVIDAAEELTSLLGAGHAEAGI